MGVHEVVIVQHVRHVAAEVFGKGCFGDDFVLVSDEEYQQFVLSPRQVYRLAGRSDGLPAEIDFDAAASQYVVRGEFPAPDYGIDAHAEFRQMKRFGEIIIRTDFQTADLVVKRIFRRHDDDTGRVAHFPHLTEDIQSVASWQHEVEHHAVVFVEGETDHRFIIIERLFAYVILGLEIFADAVGQFPEETSGESAHQPEREMYDDCRQR